jgi:hypothetical protein
MRPGPEGPCSLKTEKTAFSFWNFEALAELTNPPAKRLQCPRPRLQTPRRAQSLAATLDRLDLLTEVSGCPQLDLWRGAQWAQAGLCESGPTLEIEMEMCLMNLGGFSWRRFLGITTVKRRVSKATGIPWTRSGRERKVGALVMRALFGKPSRRRRF